MSAKTAKAKSPKPPRLPEFAMIRFADHCEHGPLKAMILWALRYKIAAAKTRKDLPDDAGRYWIFMKIADWVHITGSWWSERSVQTALKKLRQDGILVTVSDEKSYCKYAFVNLHEQDRFVKTGADSALMGCKPCTLSSERVLSSELEVNTRKLKSEVRIKARCAREASVKIPEAAVKPDCHLWFDGKGVVGDVDEFIDRAAQVLSDVHGFKGMFGIADYENAVKRILNELWLDAVKRYRGIDSEKDRCEFAWNFIMRRYGLIGGRTLRRGRNTLLYDALWDCLCDERKMFGRDSCRDLAEADAEKRREGQFLALLLKFHEDRLAAQAYFEWCSGNKCTDLDAILRTSTINKFISTQKPDDDG